MSETVEQSGASPADEGETAAGGWSDADTEEFVAFGDAFVPDREEQIRVLCDLVPATGDEACALVDLCCGEGLLAAALLTRFTAARVIAVDGSAAMLDRARQHAGGACDRLTAVQCQLDRFPPVDVRAPVRCVVSSLAIHHLEHEGQRALYDTVRRLLEPGGALLVADLVEPATEAARHLAAAMWDEAVRSRAGRLGDGDRAYATFREDGWNHHALAEPDPGDRPARIVEHLGWLDDAGFVDVDVFWMKAGHAIWGGRAPDSAGGGP